MLVPGEREEARMGTTVRHVDVICEDLEEALAFYRRAGIEIPEAAVWRHGGVAHHVGVELDSGVELSLSSTALTRAYAPSSAVTEGPIVILGAVSGAEVDERVGALTSAGATVVLEPFDAFWGSRYAIVRDPAGTLVGIMGPREREHAVPPGFEA